MQYPDLISLDDYQRPAGPTVNQLEDWFKAVRKKLVNRDSEVTVKDDQLAKVSVENVRSLSKEPDCSFVFQALDSAYLEWMNRCDPDGNLRLMVFPPCDRSERVATWARGHQFEVLDAPDRSQLLSAEVTELVIPCGDGPLVIPNLEHWFLRHRHGLRHIRTLLSALQRTSRLCLIACSSWSWAYLKKAVNADLVLPAPKSIAPLDADFLGNWLLGLISEDSSQSVIFRDYHDGKQILCREKDGTMSDKFLQQLADDSGGIPWIAWQLWRRSLRTEARDEEEGPDADSQECKKPEKQPDNKPQETVFWVVRSPQPTLPREHEPAACLLLQALLIHGSLPEPLLCAVLPSIGESNLVVAMLRSGFIERHDDELRCLATAYPAIWSSLENSGMNMATF